MFKHYSKANWIYCAALILDSRHKIETFDLTSWGKEMKAESIKQFLELYKNYYDEKQNDGNNCTETIKIDEDDIDSLYTEQIKTPIQEFETYINAPKASKESSVLSWWKQNEAIYPILSIIAKDIFGITTTSVPAERLFSKASLVIRKHKNRLNETSACWTALIVKIMNNLR